MSVWLKVCGLTQASSVDVALAENVDAIGFVFAASPRRIEPKAALTLKRRIERRAAVVAVMRHPTQAEIDDVLGTLEPDYLQTDAGDLDALNVPDSVQILPVFRGRDVRKKAPPRLLYEGAVSGAGELSDWSEARELTTRTQLILAGGLNPANVTAAIATVQPFGVDVSSGVEARRGEKDAELIRRFARAVHAAPAPWLTVKEPES
ncbi:MAG: phosphoribosylanthranilate isomerase [Gammaproteobacteria bacterium]